MQPVLALQPSKQWRRLARDEGKRRDLSLAQLFERDLLAVVHCGDRNLEQVEQTACRNCGAAAAQIEIHLAIG